MEYLSEEHAKLLLTKEWLVKSDSETSTPYLFKFYSSTVDLSCCILVTDTKNVWGEVLSSNQFARRWRDCNPQHSRTYAGEDEEDGWRIKCLEFLSSAHTLGALVEVSFEPVKSSFSDFAFSMGSDAFRWRWETFNVGPRMSADILSKHLILPLISMTHLAFSSPDPLGASSESSLEKSVDKVGRTARRTIDTHVRNALSRPLVATTLRRTTAMFNFVPDLPRIVADSPAPDLTSPPSPPATSRSAPFSKPQLRRAASPPPSRGFTKPRSGSPDEPSSPVWPTLNDLPPKPQMPTNANDSVTEEESDADLAPPSTKGKAVAQGRQSAKAPARSVPSKRGTPDQAPHPNSPRSSPPQRSPAASSSPLPAPKKAKRAQAASSSDEEDSEEERRKHLARLKAGASRGAKQPLKRGGKRF